MKQKIINFKLLMFFFTFLVIYVTLIIGDYYLHLKQFSLRKDASDILTLRQQTKDRKLISEAKDDGYVRIIYPYLYYKIKSINKKFIKDIVPVGGQANRNVYDCNEGYGLTKYKTDRFGFRNNDNIWDNILNSNKKKILFIGDSFVNGDCVHNADVISNNLKEFTTVNLGLSGNDPYVYSSLANIFIPIVQPDYVVLVFYMNDNTKDGDIFMKNLNIKDLHLRYVKNKNGKLELSDEIEEITNKVENYVLNLKKNEVSGSRPNIFYRAIRYLSLPTIRNNINIEYQSLFFKLPKSTKLSIDIINLQCKKYNCVPIFSYMPSSNFWTPSKLTKKYRDSISIYLKKNNSNFLDFTNILEILGERKSFALKGTHLSPEGYREVANEIDRFIKKIN
jgi:hypothetical protein